MVEKVKELSKSSEALSDDAIPVKFLFDEVNYESSKEICEWILEQNFSSCPPSTLNLMICSPGGDMAGGFAIIDVMQSSHIPIRTIGLGQIGSCALMIFLAGTPGQRILTPNTSILSHAYSWGSSGKHHELVAIQKEYTLTFKRMLDHYRKFTGLKESEIKKYLLPSEDVYLSADEALKYGICDSVTMFGKTDA